MTFTRTTTRLATATTLFALAACGHSSTSSGVHTHSGSLTMRDGQVVITAQGGTEALVSPEGRLTIEGREVAATEGQRAELVSYYGAAHGVVQHAVATGAAGAQVGVAAASGVVEGIVNGDMSGLKAKVEAKAGEVRRQAVKICESLAEVRTVQDALAVELEAFKPYAIVSAGEATDCGKHLHQGPGG